MEELYAHIIKRNPTTKVDVIAYNTDGAPEKETYRGMTVYRVPCIEPLRGQYAVANPIALLWLLIQLSANPYDVVHANTRFFESTAWAWIYALIIKARSVITDHVAHHPLHPNVTVTKIARLLDLTVIQWFLRRYDVVTATNEKTREFLSTTLACPNVVLTYGGVDTKMFAPGKPRKIRVIPYVRQKFSRRAIIVTFAGRLIRTKGVTLYVKAIKSLMGRLPRHVSFVIAGGGPLEKEVAAMLMTKSLKQRVYMTGPLTAAEMRQLYKATDIFVHPSYHAEGFPNAILEATASGCFVIATDNAGTKEIVRHGVTGLIIKQHDIEGLKRAIWWAITHPRNRKTMAWAGKHWTVRHFDWRTQATNFLSLVQKLYLSPVVIRRLAKAKAIATR